MTIEDDWLPTAVNVNALPDPLRRYIRDIETRCDPAGDVLLMWQLRQQCSAVEAMYVKLRDNTHE